MPRSSPSASALTCLGQSNQIHLAGGNIANAADGSDALGSESWRIVLHARDVQLDVLLDGSGHEVAWAGSMDLISSGK
jgi:hypothetical protein